MSNTLASQTGGVEAIRTVLPVVFNWPLFEIALILMAAPVAELARLNLKDWRYYKSAASKVAN